jgi:perosamine synthetase
MFIFVIGRKYWMSKIIKTIIKLMFFLLKILKLILKKWAFHFIQIPNFLSRDFFELMLLSVGKADNSARISFESEFSKLVGSGSSLLFASGRMAFYSFLKAININSNDDVIITGFTCSVMVNVILRAGATSVYVDIDPNTFGTCVDNFTKKISIRTKVIVIQHTFGIPVDFDNLLKYAAENNIH